MTFKDKFQNERRWFQKILLVELYHCTMSFKNHKWKVGDTARYFGVSIGLISENLNLAKLSHIKPEVIVCKNRQDALKLMKGKK